MLRHASRFTRNAAFGGVTHLLRRIVIPAAHGKRDPRETQIQIQIQHMDTPERCRSR
jgi:hypothetical protein